MRKFLLVLTVVALVSTVGYPARCLAEGVEADAVFEQLKALAGTWKGTPKGAGEEAEGEAATMHDVTHEIEVSAAGTVVMETMSPGTPHEMINMYHLDGEELVMTHYCAGGNQPTMQLDRAKSTADTLVFDFTGGTNLDAAVDQHIHAAEIRMVGSGHIESAWTAYSGGKQVGLMTFELAKQE